MEQEIINKIKNTPALKRQYIDLPIPAPYFADKDNIKAIVLGADPSNFSDSGETRKMKTVFDLPNLDYFRAIKANLDFIGLSMNEIYVQNVVRNYCTVVTSENIYWLEFAELWKPLLKDDLDKLDPDKKLPVFATAEIVLHSLLKDRHKQRIDASKYFTDNIYHKPDENYLERRLIPCFRHYKYAYEQQKNYADFVKTLL